MTLARTTLDRAAGRRYWPLGREPQASPRHKETSTTGRNTRPSSSLDVMRRPMTTSLRCRARGRARAWSSPPETIGSCWSSRCTRTTGSFPAARSTRMNPRTTPPCGSCGRIGTVGDAGPAAGRRLGPTPGQPNRRSHVRLRRRPARPAQPPGSSYPPTNSAVGPGQRPRRPSSACLPCSPVEPQPRCQP